MPQSKHSRKGKPRPRAYEVAPPPKNPPASPTWLGPTAVGLLIAGVVVIVVGYLPPVQDLTASWPPLGANNALVFGFLLIIGGFALLTKLR
jgi:hypothetical protein